MKVRLLIGILIAVNLIIGCSNENYLPPTGDIPEWADNLIQTVPDNIQFATFLDVETLRTDPDLQTYFTYQQGWFNISSYLSYSMLDFSQVDRWVSCSEGDLMTGSFDVRTAESYLLNNGWTRDEYEDFTVWEKEESWGQIANIAFGQEFVISGSNTSCNAIIDTIKEKQRPVCENEQFKDLIMQLPNTSFEINYGDSEFTTKDGLSISLITGNAVSKSKDGFLKHTYIIEAQGQTITDDVIEDLIDDLKNFNEAFGQTEIKVTRHESYVTIIADVPISSFEDKN